MTVAPVAPATIIRAEFPRPFHPGWDKVDGVAVQGNALIIDPAAYFYRYDAPSWLVCDWSGVERDLLPRRETTDDTIEQIALDYIREHGVSTTDPALVLTTAYQVYAYVFRAEHLQDPALARMGVTEQDLRILTEMGAVMALNRVELTGEITNAGPAWMFAPLATLVYGLDEEKSEHIDELYHSAWFNEPRRQELTLAHAAIGGRLVHGCQSGTQVNQTGGCVAPYGADIAGFRAALGPVRDALVDKIERMRCGE